MNDLIKRIDDYMQGAGEELATVILTDCHAEIQRLLLANETLVALNAEYADRIKALEAKGEAVKYWLCCGNTNPMHDSRCHELLIGNKHHVRYGTEKEHSDWQTSLYTTPPSVAALIADAVAKEREACIADCKHWADQYPVDLWPENGESIDCKGAKMARLTANNIAETILTRSAK